MKKANYQNFTYDEIENKLITIALAETSGNRIVAAKKLGMSVRTLHRRIQKRIKQNE